MIPEIEDASEDFEIRPEDYEMQVYRSSGAGGQKVNKTSSAVRLIHKSGIVVSCQTERSQFQNKETCLRMLRSKLVEIREREHLANINDIKGVQQKIEWGSQIRNYVFMPYTLVKDTRTGCETSNVNAVMDGALDPFIESYLNCLATCFSLCYTILAIVRLTIFGGPFPFACSASSKRKEVTDNGDFENGSDRD